MHGMRSRLLQDEHGQVLEAHSISAGLDYPGVGPEHAYLAEVGRARYVQAGDEEVLDALRLLSETEGIIPALEPAHALAKIIELAPKNPDDADWARRVLATLLASSGEGRAAREALHLMGLADEGASYLPSADEPPDEIRAKAKVLSLRNNRDARRAAIRCLKWIIDREPATGDDQYLLAQLYESEGNWSNANEQLQGLLAGNRENPVYLAHNVLILLRQGATDDAQVCLEKLEKLEPKALRTLELKVRILKAKGRAAEAVPLLEAFVQRNTDQLGIVAALLEELGQVAAAEVYSAHAVAILSSFSLQTARLRSVPSLGSRRWLSANLGQASA